MHEKSDLPTIIVKDLGVMGLIAGVIGSLVAPWVHWGIEKKRLRNERRVELIVLWRKILSNPSFERNVLLNHGSYGPLRDLLSQKVRKQIERPSNEFISMLNSAFDSPDRKVLLQEVSRIEKIKWKLV